MEIIKHGNLKAKWACKWSCDTCGCIWRMDGTEKPPIYTSDQRDGNAWHMPCPSCKKEVWMSDDAIKQKKGNGR